MFAYGDANGMSVAFLNPGTYTLNNDAFGGDPSPNNVKALYYNNN